MIEKNDEIRIIAVGALQKGLKAVAEGFTKEKGIQVTCQFTSPANLAKVLDDDEFDAIIVSAPAVDELVKSGRLDGASRIKMARVGIGVASREGAPKPDVSTVAAFQKAINEARNIIYTDPSMPNGSGIVTMRILAAIGLVDVVKGKGKQENLGVGKQLIATGEYEIGLFNVSEIEAPGVVVAGAVPSQVQDYTNYDGALFVNSAKKNRASEFLKFAASSSAIPMWKSGRVETP